MRRHVSSFALLLCTGCFNTHPIDEGSSGTRLELIAWEPEDGTGIHATSFFDRELGVECVWWYDLDAETWRCLPRPSGRLVFLDADCGQAAAHGCAAGDAPFFTGRRFEARTNECGGSFGYAPSLPFRTGARRTVDRVFERDPEGECVAGATGPLEVVELEPMPNDAFVSGAPRPRPRDGDDRIGEVVLAGDDGSELWMGHYDHERGAACAMLIASGRFPCVPETSGNTTGPTRCGEAFGVTYEARPECGREPPQLAVETEYDACGRAVDARVYRHGARLSEARVEACIDRPTEHIYTELIDATDEVAWLENEAEGTGRLRALPDRPRYVESWSLGTLGSHFDTELGEECSPVVVNGVMRCLPVLARAMDEDDLFADAACSEPALGARDASCSAWTYVARSDTDGPCLDWSGRDYYRIGERLDVAYRRDDTGACVVWEADGPGERDHGAFRVAPVPDDTFVAFRRL
ncbi:MAG: hypothetical protein VYE22_15040 [Myxococcota bacterium]|nr:hypothetical protein [Myxococcota bacterium]